MDKVAKSEDPYIFDEVYHSCKGVISNQVFGGNGSVYRQPVFRNDMARGVSRSWLAKVSRARKSFLGLQN